jgi:glutamate--cysteine ligase
VSRERFDALRAGIFAASFAPQSSPARTVGVEVELLAHDVDTNRPIPLHAERGGLVAAIQRIARRKGWNEFRAYDDTVRFDVPGQALISFEPGGQIEISSVPSASVTALVARVQEIVRALRVGLEHDGIDLRSIGIDPHNDAASIPLQLQVDRYRNMTRYFDGIGPYGIRMMRQTAAIQVSIDRGADPAARWRLLNDLAPYLIAIFANSPIYAGEDTDHRSFRALCWRRLDPTRTGVAIDGADPSADYARFALHANDMMRVDEHGRYRSYSHWLAAETDDTARWSAHTTTLFPEVRPRGHFEVRSCDAIAPEWYAAPIVLIAGLVYDETASREASILAAESRALLRTAGERGLRDTEIARTARDLFQLALDGAARLGAGYVSGEIVEIARAFYSHYTARERSPADDALDDLRASSATRPIGSPI